MADNWTSAFHRSRLSRFVFNVSADYKFTFINILRESEIATDGSGGGMFDSSSSSWGLLDGAALNFQHYGFPAGRLADGLKVIGFAPMRLLCILGDVRQPRRLSEEDRVSTVDELHSAWLTQLANPNDEAYQWRAHVARHVYDGPALITAVSQLYGEK